MLKTKIMTGLLVLFVLCISVLTSPSALAKDSAKKLDKGGGVEFYFDDPPKAKHNITENFKFGANFEIQYEFFEGLNLNNTIDDQSETFTPNANFVFSYTPAVWASAFLEITLEDQFFINRSNSSVNEKSAVLELKQGYITLDNAWNELSLQIGRQRFKDNREWWFDENLDAVHLLYRYRQFGINASISRQELFESDFLNAETEEQIDNYLFSMHYAISKKTDVSGYLLYINDQTDRQRDKLYVGLQSTGKFKYLKYWLDSAVLLGSNKDKDYRAYAFDLGVTYRSKFQFEPSLTMGVALGSGDSDTGDNIDETFRQTGLEDNNGKFNGVTKFKYYGELLDPELSNLWILTAATGIKPTRKSSIDVVYHYYRQHQLDDNFRTELSIDPNEKSKYLGQELDIIIGIREINHLNIELIFGTFFAGNAFSDASDNSYYGKLEMAYRY
jgi:alginate production protein